jgi:hypothetical protein
MSHVGLLSGSADRVQRLSQLLKDAGADPLIITDPAALPGAPCSEGLDFYIQLPVTIHADGHTAVARVGSFLTAGLLARFSAVDRVLPVLAPGATVVLVSGNAPDEMLPDDQQSRLALLHLLAHATRAELATRHVEVKVVSSHRSDQEIVHYALGGHDDAHPHRDPQERASAAIAYQDWRTEVMGLVGIDI